MKALVRNLIVLACCVGGACVFAMQGDPYEEVLGKSRFLVQGTLGMLVGMLAGGALVYADRLFSGGFRRFATGSAQGADDVG